MNQADRPIVSPHVVLREEFDDWAVLFNPDTADAVGVNPVGVAVWKLMDGTSSLDAIVTEIQSRFGEVPATAREEIDAFIGTLTEQGFVGHVLPDPGR